MQRTHGTHPVKGNRRIWQPLVALLLAVLLAACGAKATPSGSEATSLPGTASPLAGTEWVLTSLNGESLLEGTEINLGFKERYLGGSMTCNGYGGSPDTGQYVAKDDGTLTPPPLLAVTVQLCSEPEGIMEQEAAYIEALLSAATYRVAGDRLEFINAARETILVYAAKTAQ